MAEKMGEDSEFGTFGVSELRFPTTRDSLDDSSQVWISILPVPCGAYWGLQTELRTSDIPVFLSGGASETINSPDSEEQAHGFSSKDKRRVSDT